MRALVLVSWFVALLVPQAARASEPVRFEYRAPPGCPNEAAFIERVRERALYERFAADGELARTFVVTVRVDASAAAARVDFVDGDGSAVFRNVKGSTCEEAVSGIALVCALAIDGRATPEEPGASTPPLLATTSPGSGTAPAPSTLDRPAPQETSASLSRAPSPSFSVGFGAGYASHLGPAGAPAIDAFFGGRLTADGPSARVSAFHFWSEGTSSGREARFRGYGLRLEACPLAFGSTRLFAEPCLGTNAGVLLASAVESAAVPEPRDDAKGYWDVVAILRLGSEVSRFFVLELQGELAIPLVDYRYGFGEPPNDVTVYEMPSVGVSARGAVGFRFQ